MCFIWCFSSIPLLSLFQSILKDKGESVRSHRWCFWPGMSIRELYYNEFKDVIDSMMMTVSLLHATASDSYPTDQRQLIRSFLESVHHSKAHRAILCIIRTISFTQSLAYIFCSLDIVIGRAFAVKKIGCDAKVQQAFEWILVWLSIVGSKKKYAPPSL